jgi:hypothetical protein
VVEGVLDWNDRSRALDVLRRASGVLVIGGGHLFDLYGLTPGSRGGPVFMVGFGTAATTGREELGLPKLDPERP